MCSGEKSKKIWGIVLLVVGIILFIASIVLGFVIIPKKIEQKIIAKLQLTPDGDTFKRWANVNRPVFMDFYIFNVTNPDVFNTNFNNKHNEEKKYQDLVVDEIGPYVYEEKRFKDNITFSPDGRYVSYQERITFHFRRELSKTKSGRQLSDNDLVNIVNMPYILTISKAAKTMVGIGDGMASSMWNSGERIIRKDAKVGEFLFTGMDISDITSEIWTELPPDFEGNVFGVRRLTNNTASKIIELQTGTESPDSFGKVASYDGKRELDYYEGDCNAIKGSDGTVFPPFLKTDQTIYIFNKDLCRSLKLTFLEESKVLNINSYKFRLDPKNLQYGDANPENVCYSSSDPEEYTVPTGTISIKQCKNDAPVLISNPHFLYGDDSLQNSLVAYGLSPDPKMHQTVIDLEPYSGLMLKAHKAIQLNVEFKFIKGVRAFTSKYVQGNEKKIMPVLWMNERTEISEMTSQGMQSQLIKPRKMIATGKFVVMGISILLMLIGAVLLYLHHGYDKVPTKDTRH